MAQTPRAFFDSIQTTGEWGAAVGKDFKTVLDAMGEQDKRALLLNPMSKDVQETALSYIVMDGISVGGNSSSSSGTQWHSEFLKVALDEIEKLTQDRGERVALLTQPNALGQTLFHKALAYGTNQVYGPEVDLFEQLAERLIIWGGVDYGTDFLKKFLDEPLGVLKENGNLQHVRNETKFGSEEYNLLNGLAHNSQALGYEGLKAAFNKSRPYVLAWADRHQGETKYPGQYADSMRQFAEGKAEDYVTQGPTPIARAFPGVLFWPLVDLRKVLNDETPQQTADFIYNVLSAADVNGLPRMHNGPWNGYYSGQDGNRIGEYIANFEKRLGKDIALDLTKKLLLLEDDKGNLPLDKFHRPSQKIHDEYKEHLGEEDVKKRDDGIKYFLKGLRQDLGSRQTFGFYVKEIIASVLPANFKIKLDEYEPDAPPVINPKTGKPAPRRGAQIEA